MVGVLQIRGQSIYLPCLVLFLINCSPAEEENKPETHTVEIRQMQFQPAELTVHSGDTVVWINRDIVAHDVTEQPGKKWASPPLNAGESWRMVATQSSDYYCSIHVVMKGKLVVQ